MGTFTALADLQLVSEGKLDLNSDVSEYLDFTIERYKSSKITLHHLLTHSAGLDEKLLGGGTKDKSEVPKLATYLSSSPPVQTPYKCSAYATFFHVITFLTIGFYLYLSDGLVFDFGLPWFLKVLMLLPIVAVILTIFSAYMSRSVWYEWSISKFKKALFQSI